MSNCCNCFIVFVTLFAMFKESTNCGMVYSHVCNLFSLLMHCHHQFAFHVNINGSFMALFMSILMTLSFFCFSGEIDRFGGESYGSSPSPNFRGGGPKNFRPKKLGGDLSKKLNLVRGELNLRGALWTPMMPWLFC